MESLGPMQCWVNNIQWLSIISNIMDHYKWAWGVFFLYFFDDYVVFNIASLPKWITPYYIKECNFNMDAMIESSKFSTYWPKSCQFKMEWFYFDKKMSMYADELSIKNQYPVMMSVIKSFSLLSYKIIIWAVEDGVSSVNLKCIFCKEKIMFQSHISHS